MPGVSKDLNPLDNPEFQSSSMSQPYSWYMALQALTLSASEGLQGRAVAFGEEFATVGVIFVIREVRARVGVDDLANVAVGVVEIPVARVAGDVVHREQAADAASRVEARNSPSVPGGVLILAG